jgi:hypothetical protein
VKTIDLDKADRLRDELYPNQELATAIGLRLDAIASLIPPSGVRRNEGEADQDFRQRAIEAYRSAIIAHIPLRCAYCGCTYPCVCFADSTTGYK